MNTNQLLAWLRAQPLIGYETDSTRAGCTVRNCHRSSERYEVDFADDYKAEGWQQFDTSQDAPYFGVWLNPRHRAILTYCEGDWSLEECPTDAHYVAAVQRRCDCYEPGRVARCIGTDGSVVDVHQDRSEFLKGEAADVIGIGDVIRAAAGGAS